MITAKRFVTQKTVPPAVPELFIDERFGKYLLLNPSGPRWCVGSKVVADFVKLCDGRRSIESIFELMTSRFDRLTSAHLIYIAQSLIDAQFFEEGHRFQIRPLSNVAFNLTKLCNLNCPFCYYDSIPMTEKPHDQELSTSEWIKLAGQIAMINPNARIYVSGGEPLIRRDIVDILDGISTYDLEVTLVTNGTLFTRAEVSQLAVIPKLRIQVSIDSIVPKENSRTRGFGNLEKALIAVQWMKDAGVNVKVSATITQINKNSIWRLKRFCTQNEIGFRTSIFFLGGERSKKNSKQLGLDVNELWDTLLYNAARLNSEQLDAGLPHLTPGVPRYGCGVGYGTIAVNPDGSVSPCNHLTDPKLSLGNVRQSNLRQLVGTGYKLYNFVDVSKMPGSSCAKCPVRYFCGGWCRASSFHTYGSMHVVPPDCSFFRQTFIESLWIDVMGTSYSWLGGLRKENQGNSCVTKNLGGC